jgi:hypothetical protein
MRSLARLFGSLRMSLLLVRVRKDPAKFLERAGFHCWSIAAADCLFIAARYVHGGMEIPKWLFR